MTDLSQPQNANDSSSMEEGNLARSSGAKLFAETIAAHGGEAFLNLQSLKITGQGEFTTPPQTGGLTVPLSSFTFYIAIGGRSRLEARSPGGALIFVSSGNDLGGFVVLVGRTLPLPADQTNGIEVTEFLRRIVKEGYPVSVVEDDPAEITTDGKTLLHYEVHRPVGTIVHIYVESDTKLVRKMISKTSRGEMTVLLSNYKLAAGLPAFQEMQLWENGGKILKLTASEVTRDVPMKDTLFTQP